VIPGDGDRQSRDQIVVHEGERNAVLGADGRADDHFIDVIELIPVLIAGKKAKYYFIPKFFLIYM